MFIKRIVDRLSKKPPLLVIIPFLFSLGLLLIRWQLSFPISSLLFLSGAVVGLFILDIAEEFFNLYPSPFKTMLFTLALCMVSFYVQTSTQEFLARGLCYTLTTTLFLQQWSAFKLSKNLSDWYGMIFSPPTLTVQKASLAAFALFIIFESFALLAF